MLYLCKFVIFRIKLKGNLLACRSLSPWHASLPVLTYAIPVFFDGLPKYLKLELERIRGRGFSIISPNIAYSQALQEANIPTIIDYSELQ
jgi:hypothetical protein